MSLIESTAMEVQLLNELKCLIEGTQDQIAKSNIHSILDDTWLQIFLRCNDLNPPKAYKSGIKIVNAISHEHSDWFMKLHPETLKDIFMSNAVTVLKDKDNTGNCVIVVRIQSWNVKTHSLDELIISAILAGVELIQTDIQMQIQGAAILIDVNGMSFAQAKQVSPFLLKKLIDILFQSLPLKINAIHVVNLNYLVNALVRLGKSLLPRRAADLLYTHNTSQSLYSHIPKKSLPSWLGGDNTDDQVLNHSIKDTSFNPQRINWYQMVVKIASEEKSFKK